MYKWSCHAPWGATTYKNARWYTSPQHVRIKSPLNWVILCKNSHTQKKMPTVVATNLHRSKSKTSRPKQYPTTMTRCRRPWGSTWRASCRESETDISWLAGRTLAQPQLTEDFDFSLKALQVKGSWSLSRLDFSWGDVLFCISKNMRFEVWRGERNKKSNIQHTLSVLNAWTSRILTKSGACRFRLLLVAFLGRKKNLRINPQLKKQPGRSFVDRWCSGGSYLASPWESLQDGKDPVPIDLKLFEMETSLNLQIVVFNGSLQPYDLLLHGLGNSL